MTFAVVVIVILLANSIKILKEYERGVIFTLGRVDLETGVKGPGLVIVLPFIQKVVKVSLRTITMDVPSQDVITKDNVTVKVNAVVYFKAMDPRRAVVEVEDYHYATSLIAQTTLRSVLGQSQLDDLLSKREEINSNLQKIIDQQTEPWGVKVSIVEVKNVDLPESMQRAIAKQAEAERERRAKVINAEAEYQAAQKLADAAAIIQSQPAALQLRYLQSMLSMAGDKNTTTVFPIPIDLFTPFIESMRRAGGSGKA